MATTFSTLRSRLYERLGVTVASTAEAALADECLNAAISKIGAEGAPQWREVYSGYTLAPLSTTVSAHTSSTASVTLNSVVGVYPGDILEDTANSKKFIIRTVNSVSGVVGIGIPVAPSLSGNTVSVVRRSFLLPTSGTVYEVRKVDEPHPLKEDLLASSRLAFETGTPKYFTQQFTASLSSSVISFYPAPSTANTQFIIIQAKEFAADSDVDASEALLSYILAEAVKYRRLLSLPVGAQGAAAMADDMKGLRTKSSANVGMATR